jgi:hypothetical protein
MKHCIICNKRVWWHWFRYRAMRMLVSGQEISICSERCYMTLFSAYEQGLAGIVYGIED